MERARNPHHAIRGVEGPPSREGPPNRAGRFPDDAVASVYLTEQ